MSTVSIPNSPDDLIMAWRWPETNGKPVCPRCGSQKIYVHGTRKIYGCASNGCRHQFSWKSGTPFHNSKLSEGQIVDMIRLCWEGTSAYAASKELGVQYGTAWQRFTQMNQGLDRVPPRGNVDRERRAQKVPA